MFLILILYALFAATFTLGAMAMEVVPPLFFVGVRMVISGLLLLGYVYCIEKKHWFYKSKDFFLFAQLTLFHIFFAFTLEFWALKYVTGAKASLIYNLSPFTTAILAYFLFSEKLNKQKIFGLIIGFIGIVPILLAQQPAEQAGLLSISLAELCLLGAVVSAAYGWILLQKSVQQGYSYFFANGIAMFFGGLLSFASAFIIEGRPQLTLPRNPNDVIAEFVISFAYSFAPLILFLFYTIIFVIIANIIVYNLYGYLLKKYSPTFLAFAGITCPLFTALYDWILLDSVVAWQFYVSLIITSFGLYIFYKQELLG